MPNLWNLQANSPTANDIEHLKSSVNDLSINYDEIQLKQRVFDIRKQWRLFAVPLADLTRIKEG